MRSLWLWSGGRGASAFRDNPEHHCSVATPASANRYLMPSAKKPPVARRLLHFFVLAEGNLLFGFAAFCAVAHRFEALFAALGAVGGALHQLAADEFENGLFAAVALAPAQASDASIAALPLAETCAELIEELLHRSRRHEEAGRLPAGMQR